MFDKFEFGNFLSKGGDLVFLYGRRLSCRLLFFVNRDFKSLVESWC